MDFFSMTAAITSTTDARQTSPLSRARRVHADDDGGDEEDPALSKIERLRRRTRALRAAHSANSAKVSRNSRP